MCKVLRGGPVTVILEAEDDNLVILEAGGDNNLWFNDTEVLYSTILDDLYQNISKKEFVTTYLVPNNN